MVSEPTGGRRGLALGLVVGGLVGSLIGGLTTSWMSGRAAGEEQRTAFAARDRELEKLREALDEQQRIVQTFLSARPSASAHRPNGAGDFPPFYGRPERDPANPLEPPSNPLQPGPLRFGGPSRR